MSNGLNRARSLAVLAILSAACGVEGTSPLRTSRQASSPGQDFSVAFDSSDGTQLTLPATGTTTAVIDLTAIDGLTGNVNLFVSGFPANTWGTLSSYYAPVGAPITLTANSSWAVAESATITVTAIGSSGTHTATFPLVVAGGTPTVPGDFSVSFDSTDGSKLTLPATGSTTALIDLTALNGFTGKVNLSISGFPANTWGTLNSYYAPVGTPLTLTASSSAAIAESATITITAVGSSGTHTATFPLVVAGGTPTVPGDFAVSFDSTDGSKLTLPATGSTTALIDLTALNGFTGNVNLSISGFPANTWGTLNSYYAPVGTPLTLTANSSAAIPESATITITAVGSSGTHTATFPLVVAGGTPTEPGDFSVSFDSTDGSKLTLPSTGTTTALIDLTALNGFAGNVNLSISGFPANAWGTLSSYYAPVGTPVTLTASSSWALPEAATITITAIGSSGTHTATFPLTVAGGVPTEPADFTVSFDSTDGSQLTLPATGSTTALIDLSAVNGFTGKVNLSLSGFPANTWGTLSSYYAPVGTPVTLTVNSSSGVPESATITVTAVGASGTHTATFPLIVAGGTPTTPGDFTVAFDSTDGSKLALPATGTTTALIDLTALNGFTGNVNLSISGFPANTWGTLSSYYAPVGTPITLTASSSWATSASATITITAVGSSGTHTATFPLVVTGN